MGFPLDLNVPETEGRNGKNYNESTIVHLCLILVQTLVDAFVIIKTSYWWNFVLQEGSTCNM